MSMSENSYPKAKNLLNESFDVEAFIEEEFFKGVEPDSYMSVSEWADKYRMLSSKSASEPGRWRTARTPYLKEIMDCLSPKSPVQKVVFMKGAQIGGTECGNNWLGYIMHKAPGPIMAVSPTVEMAKRNSRQRIDPLIEDCPPLRNLVSSPRSRDKGNTMLSKDFQGGVLVMTGANSAVGLRSMPARYLFMDEVDGYPQDIDGEGDPILLAEHRTATFNKRKKIFLVSTPIKGLSNIEREFENSDKRYFFVPCPFCGEFQKLEWAQIRAENGKAEYECCHCHKLIDHYERSELQAAIVNAMIAAFIETPMGGEELNELFGGSTDDYLNAKKDWQVKLEGGSIIPIFPGDKVAPFTPSRPNSAYGAFVENLLRHIGTGLNIPYELLLKDFSKTNYSSARSALLEAWRYFNGRRQWLADYWATPVYELWLEEVVNKGLIDAPDFYQNRYAYSRCKWIGPGRGWVDPVKEAQACQIRMEIGLSTLEAECASQGLDWEEVLEQRAREKNKIKKMGLDEVKSNEKTVILEEDKEVSGK